MKRSKQTILVGLGLIGGGTSFVHVRSPSRWPPELSTYQSLSAADPTDTSDPADEREYDRASPSAPPVKPRTVREIRSLTYVMVNDVEELMKTNASAASKMALDNLQRLERMHNETGNQAYRSLSKPLYNSLVRSFAKSGTAEHAHLGELTYYEMKRKAETTGDEHLLPDATTACAVIDGYARSGGKSGPLNAERFLFELMDDAEAATREGVPEENIILPTSASANGVIKAWAGRNSREGAARAQGILDRMEDLQSSAEGGGRAIRPTAYSYATVISAWNHADRGIEAAERGEAILNKLHKMADQADKEDCRREDIVRPNTIVWNNVIDGYANSLHPTGGTRALGLLKRMLQLSKDGNAEVAPDAITYRSVINAFANSGHINSAKSAESVMEMAVAEGIAIDTRTYNTVLKAWSSCNLPGAAIRSHDILKSMIDAHRAGNKNVGPDVYSWSTVASCFAKSSEPCKAQRARDLLIDQIEYWKSSHDDNSKPNSHSYNSVLNAAAFSAMATDNEERKEALQIAVQTFNDLLSAGYAEADEVSYGSMLKCIANLVPKSSSKTRNQMASMIFVNCAESGLVSDFVLKEAKRSLTADCLLDLVRKHVSGRSSQKLTGVDSITLSSLPKEWKSNIAREKTMFSLASGKGKPSQRRKKRESQKKVPKKETTATPLPSVMLTETSWQSGRDV